MKNYIPLFAVVLLLSGNADAAVWSLVSGSGNPSAPTKTPICLFNANTKVNSGEVGCDYSGLGGGWYIAGSYRGNVWQEAIDYGGRTYFKGPLQSNLNTTCTTRGPRGTTSRTNHTQHQHAVCFYED